MTLAGSQLRIKIEAFCTFSVFDHISPSLESYVLCFRSKYGATVDMPLIQCVPSQ